MFKPIHDNVLLRRAAKQDRTEGGIIIPEKAQKKVHRGEVLAVGPGVVNERGTFIPTTLQPGQVILFGENTGRDVTIEGEEYVIMSEQAVLGVVED